LYDNNCGGFINDENIFVGWKNEIGIGGNSSVILIIMFLLHCYKIYHSAKGCN
jgi:hypothetical protein